jgi:LmbE family N-acetylglucosaminyl deacetylase
VTNKLRSLAILLFSVPMAFYGTFKAGGADSSQVPKQGAKLLKTDVMGVFAHPDDETGVASTLARYALGEGKVVANVYCTRGEGGGNMVGTHWGASLGLLREAELRDCLRRLGVRYCYFLDQLDWAYTESVAATLQKWGKEETLRRLVRHVRALRPEVIITMNPAPSPGQHGHHQAAGVLATEAFEAAADPNRFSEQITKEGLTIWQVRKLYYRGGSGENVATIATTNTLPDGKTAAQIAGEALSNHRSQAFGNMANASWLSRPQQFTLVKSVIAIQGLETDLLEHLPVADAEAKPVGLGRPRAKVSPVMLRFVPRPAIAQYEAWVKDQHIEHVAASFPADVVVVSGEPSIVEMEVVNGSNDDATGDIKLTASDGWRWGSDIQKYAVPAGKIGHLALRLEAPAGNKVDAELTAITQIAGERVEVASHAHPVPRTTAANATTAPSLDCSGRGWEALPAIVIHATDLVEGKVADEADSSATFRLAHDRQVLFVDVEVKDDHVVTNIAPNDIRGHWRSDSVEICIDSAAGAENTMGCFKLGIFPFDTTGVVRAARDADANQGPIEETAPGTRIASRRTADGYRIQAAIPFREMGVSLDKTNRIGFNLIIYDGDKTEAAVGENINKSRIAWAPRGGVQGRPEDWGRVDLQ